MTEADVGRQAAGDDDEISMLALGSLLLRRRWMIIALGFAGGLLGLATGLMSTRMYVAFATFVPQGSESGSSGLALAASQFGIRVPTSSGTWGPPVYVDLLQSPTLLQPLAFDTVTVAEERGRRVVLMDLLEIEAPTPAERADRTVRELAGIVNATEMKTLSAVKVSVTSRWPSVSLALAQELLRGVNQFNVMTRKSQATAERQFVELQADRAERELRVTEDRLQSFNQQNRIIGGSAELGLARDRLMRDVSLHQQVYTSLVQNRDEARIREVRDTPVITILEEPRLPYLGVPRRSIQKGVLGGIAGVIFGALFAVLSSKLGAMRRAPSDDAQEFFHLLEQMTPRALRKKAR